MPKAKENHHWLHGAIGLFTGAVVGAIYCPVSEWVRFDVWTSRFIPFGLVLGGFFGLGLGIWKGWEMRGWKGAIFGGVTSGMFAPFFFFSLV